MCCSNWPTGWPAGPGRAQIVLAVDVSNWLRPAAATSPGRCFCHTYARGKGAAQMIPGWKYSWIVALEAGRTSCAAPLDVARLDPDADETAAGAAQLRAVVARLQNAGQHHDSDPDILVVMDSGYDVTRLAWLLDGLPVVLIARLRSNRVLCAPPGTTIHPCWVVAAHHAPREGSQCRRLPRMIVRSSPTTLPALVPPRGADQERPEAPEAVFSHSESDLSDQSRRTRDNSNTSSTFQRRCSCRSHQSPSWMLHALPEFQNRRSHACFPRRAPRALTPRRKSGRRREPWATRPTRWPAQWSSVKRTPSA